MNGRLSARKPWGLRTKLFDHTAERPLSSDWSLNSFITARQQRCLKVMFHRCLSVPSRGRLLSGGRLPGTTKTGGMHPTGMLSCYGTLWENSIKFSQNFLSKARIKTSSQSTIIKLFMIQSEPLICQFLGIIITAPKRSLRRLCFHRCLSVHRGVYLPDPLYPWADTPSPTRQTPPGQTPGRPPGRHPPGRHLPWAHTPGHLGIHPPVQCMLGYTHPIPTLLPSACWYTVNKRAIRIPLECILVYIRVYEASLHMRNFHSNLY